MTTNARGEVETPLSEFTDRQLAMRLKLCAGDTQHFVDAVAEALIRLLERTEQL